MIVVSSVIRGIGNACGGATMWAMVSDTIDYGEWKTGYRTEGLVNSACSFGYKIGNGIGSGTSGGNSGSWRICWKCSGTEQLPH